MKNYAEKALSVNTTPCHNLRPEHENYYEHFMQQEKSQAEMCHILRKRVVSPGLIVSNPDDLLEQDADRMAENVMRMPEPGEEQTDRLQTKAGEDGAQTGLESPFSCQGVPLPEHLRAFYEPRFGYDFRNVRLHTGFEATESARELKARAFTTGRDIYFGAGQYSPETSQGKQLLAHELTHVVQQNRGLQPKRFWLQRAADPLQTMEKGVYFVSDPLKYKDTRIAYLPLATQVEIVDQGSGEPFNAGLSDKKYEWWKVKITDCSKKSLVGKTGWVMKVFLRGARNSIIYYQGEAVGAVEDSYINCLGHAARVQSSVQVVKSLEKVLLALGYQCKVGKSTDLASHIAAGKEVMMVYLYMFKSSWRSPADQGLSYVDLARKYGWDESSWKKDTGVLYTASGDGLPTDFHGLTYNHTTGKWEWVGHRKSKSGGTYTLDSTTSHPATGDPDKYFSDEQVLTRIACWK